jgi:hypothetical protein
MVAEGSLIESFKASTQNSLLQGFALAVALHFSLLVITPKFSGLNTGRLPSLVLSIRLQKIYIQPPRADTTESKPKPATTKQPAKLEFPEQIMAAQAGSDDYGRELKPTIEL